MPRQKKDPSYRLHKQSGQAIVTLPDGMGGRQDVLLGTFDTPESRQEYRRILLERESHGRGILPRQDEQNGLSMNELLVTYLRFAERYYLKNGKATSEIAAIKAAIRFVKELYGLTPAAKFSPRCLKAVQQAMIDHPIVLKVKVKEPETGEARWQEKVLRNGLARKCINKQIGRIKRLFGWAVEEELVPVQVHLALLRVKGLKKGKTAAREKARIRPVPDAFVEAILPLVPPTVRTMIEVQRLCGGRPQDIVEMRAMDIDMTGPVWEYRPARYKTEHHNDDGSPDQERVVFLGPRAQGLLKPYLTLNITDYLFSPARSETARNEIRRQKRKSPMTPSQAGRRRKANRKLPPRDRYDVATYRRAIRRACKKAGVPVWFPLQLRHSRGTEIRKCYGLEASQAVLGHAEVGVTQLYAEVNHDAARRVMGEIG